MSLYDFDTEIIGKQLLPPQLRKAIQLAWVKVILTPIQWCRDRFFDDYIGGVTATEWDSVTTFFKGVHCIYSDNAVYECTQTNSNTPPDQYPDYWIKIQDCFIGVDERLKYNAQIIVFEYALNRWFKNVGATDQIYIETNDTNGDMMVMANSSVLSSNMAGQSIFSTSFMGNAYTASAQYDYTIYFPAALFATLGATVTDQENAVRNIANKYNVAGMQYNIITF